jgi:hypothetical protein
VSSFFESPTEEFRGGVPNDFSNYKEFVSCQDPRSDFSSYNFFQKNLFERSKTDPAVRYVPVVDLYFSFLVY